MNDSYRRININSHFYGAQNLIPYPILQYNQDHIKQLLSQLALKDDERAFEQLYNLFYERMYATSYNYLKNKPLAEEVVSDVFYKIWQKRSEMNEVRNFESFLFISVRNLSFNYLRNNTRISNESLDDSYSHISDSQALPDEEVQAQELQGLLTKSIDKLPKKCKAIFKMIRFEGLKYKEVASQLDISINTVDTQMRIAMRKLAESLGDFSK